MPDDALARKIAEMEGKIDAIYATTEKIRKYFLWTLVITLALVVLPALGLMLAVPSFISTYNQTLQGLDLEGL